MSSDLKISPCGSVSLSERLVEMLKNTYADVFIGVWMVWMTRLCASGDVSSDSARHQIQRFLETEHEVY